MTIVIGVDIILLMAGETLTDAQRKVERSSLYNLSIAAFKISIQFMQGFLNLLESSENGFDLRKFLVESSSDYHMAREGYLRALFKAGGNDEYIENIVDKSILFYSSTIATIAAIDVSIARHADLVKQGLIGFDEVQRVSIIKPTVGHIWDIANKEKLKVEVFDDASLNGEASLDLELESVKDGSCLLLVLPNNPTGSVVNKESFVRIVDSCKRKIFC